MLQRNAGARIERQIVAQALVARTLDVEGFAVYAFGWETFFWATLATGIPGMIMLSRFIPFTAREPEFRVEVLAGSA